MIHEWIGDKPVLPEAVIIDLDDTLFSYPHGRKLRKGYNFAKKHHNAGRALIILTARSHEREYEYSHAQLLSEFPYPFIGPFCRPQDDPRFACDFKLDVYQKLSGLYNIVAAIDDDPFVLEMWRSVPGLSVVDCGGNKRKVFA